MEKITVPSSVVALRSDRPLTPAMISTVWEIASALDEQRIPATVSNSVWLEVPTARLRGPGARPDNIWLRECLERLSGVKLSGEHRGDAWGAVVLAQWHIIEGGSIARLLLPPAGVHALRAPANFTKIEAVAAHRLTGHGRRLYALLADKKRLGRPYWVYTIEEIRALLGVDDKRAYDRWNNFRARVLDPAVAAINEYGTVSVKMIPEKQGRSIRAVRFEWRWKDPHQAAEMAEANIHSSSEVPPVAPPQPQEPALKEPQPDPALEWWGMQTEDQREKWSDLVGRTLKRGPHEVKRREADIARSAFAAYKASQTEEREREASGLTY